MARKAVIPDTDTEEVAGLLNEHALGTGTRSRSRPESARRGGHSTSPKAGSSRGKTRNPDAQGNRRSNRNTANRAVKRAPEHTRQLRSATRSVEPQAAPVRKRKRDDFDINNVIEEEAEEHGGNSSRTTKHVTQTATPSEKRRSTERQHAPGSSPVSRVGPDEYSDRRGHVAVPDSEVEAQASEAEVEDSVGEETEGAEATSRIALAAPFELDEEALETKMLLGNEHLWKMIKEASIQNRRRAAKRNELESNIMTDLVKKLKNARQIYHRLAAHDLAAERMAQTEAELVEGLNEVCVTVDDLSRASAGRQASKVVYEAYMNGVSQFVSLLKTAMKGRVLKSSSKAYDLDGLGEVVFVQDMFLRFLEKLNSWKVSSEGFTRNVQQRIKPYLRAMLANFKKHLAKERIAEKRRVHQDITASQPIAEIVSPQVQQQRKLARLEEIRRRILRSAQEESLRWGGNLQLVEEMRSPVLHRAPIARAAETRSDAWTIEEDTALIHELLNNRETRGLPGMMFLLSLVLSFQNSRDFSRRALPHDSEQRIAQEQAPRAH